MQGPVTGCMALSKVIEPPPDVGVKTSLQEKISVSEGVKKADGSVKVVFGPMMPRSTTSRTLTPVGVGPKEGSTANWTMLYVLPPKVNLMAGNQRIEITAHNTIEH